MSHGYQVIWGGAIALGLLALGSAGWWRSATALIPLAQLEAQEALHASRFEEFSGVRVHFVDEGPVTGPVVVLLHGNLNSLRLWDQWTAILVGKGYRVVRFDLPPYGLSGDGASQQYGIVKTFEILGELLDRLEVGSSTLVGAANGGPPAAWYAYRYPDRVSRLVLVNTPFMPSLRPFPADFDRFVWMREHIYGRIGRPPMATATYVRRLVGATSAGAPTSAFIKHIHAIGRRADVLDPLDLYGSSFAFASELHNPDGLTNEAMLGRLSLPVLLIWGGYGLLDPIESERLEDLLANSRVTRKVHPLAGHWLPVGDTEPLGDLLDFLQPPNALGSQVAHGADRGRTSMDTTRGWK